MTLRSESNEDMDPPSASDPHLAPIASEGALTLFHSRTPSPAFVAHIAKTEWGDTGLKVRSLDAAHELARLGEQDFYEVRDATSRTVATYALVARRLELGSHRIEARYRCLMSVDRSAGHSGVGTRLGRWIRELVVDRAHTPTLFYGFIDSENPRSLAVAARSGYRPLTHFHCVNIGWLAPGYLARKDPAVRRLRPHELDAARTLLEAQRSAHAAPPLAHALHYDELWGLFGPADRLLAVAQVVAKQVTVTSLPGKTGPLLRRIAPALAPLSGVFELRNRKVPWLCNLAAAPAPDRAELLARLFRGIQRHTQSHGLVVYLHPTSPLNRELTAANAFGPLARLSPPSRFEVMADLAGPPSPITWDSLSQAPWWFSPLESV